MMTDFFAEGSATDEHYLTLRNSSEPIRAAGRAFVERLWEQVAPYVDADVPKRAAHAYLSCFWELYLAHVLLERGIRLVPRINRTPAKKGPDLLAESPKAWIEAVAPGPGLGPDAVPELVTGSLGTVPDEQVKLRLRTAIDEKKRRIDTYKERGWVGAEDPVVVAVNGARIDAAMFEATIPRIVRCLLPIGHEVVHIDRTTGAAVDRSFVYQAQITKRSGSDVSTDLFLDPAYASISGVLYSRAHELNYGTAGQDFVFCQNPLAAAPLPHGWLPVGVEYWVEGNRLYQNKHGEVGV